MFQEAQQLLGNTSHSRLDTMQQLLSTNKSAVFVLKPGPIINKNMWSGQINFKCKVNYPSTVNLHHLDGEIRNFFRRLLKYGRLVSGIGPDDRYQVVVYNPATGQRNATKFSSNVNENDIMNIIEEKPSGVEFDPDVCEFTYIYVKSSVGGGYYKTSLSIQEFLQKKKHIINVPSDNNNCFYYCLALGLAENISKTEYTKLLKSKKNMWNKAALDIKRQFISLNVSGVSINNIKLFEQHYEIRIMLIDLLSMKTLYGGSKYTKYCCFLLVRDSENYANSHYNYISKDHIGSLWAKRHFCFICFKGYQDLSHKCIPKCKACKRSTCKGIKKDYVYLKHCDKCNLKFYDDNCFNYHLKKLCDLEKMCSKCNRLYTTRQKHVCYKTSCRSCKKDFDSREGHECFHTRNTSEPEITDNYIFYDYETCLNEDNEHVFVMVVAMYLNSDDIHVFDNHDNFITWLFSPTHKDYTAIAHNGGKYDFHFIKQEMIKRGIKSSDVCSGNTIFYSYAKDFHIRFIDSYKLISIGLRQFPKSFGIKEIKKGYFPYKYMKISNLHELLLYLPTIEYYEFDHLKEYDRLDGLAWYEANNRLDIPTSIFDICKEYCISDVKLLKEGCMVFRNLFLEISNHRVDPLQCITIASCCMKLYKTLFLPENTIACLPLDQKEMDIKFEALKHEIKYVQNLNGYCIETDSVIYELLNCLDNGCMNCYPRWKVHPEYGLKMYELYYNWKHKTRNKEYVPYWNCRYNPSVENIESYIPYIRDGFYGGRTEPFKMYYKCKENEKIRYYDYTSLYPSVQSGYFRELYSGHYEEKYRDVEFPIGFPTCYGNISNWRSKFGFIKCKVSCPKGLYIPFLPEKKNGKLMFDLKSKIGTWTIMEVLKAEQLGYIVEEVYGVIHFKERSVSLFKNYVNKFIAKKIEAGGKKKLGFSDELEVKNFIKECYDLGICINEANFNDNPGMYFLMKLCLNNLWGKFAQRDQYKNTVDVFDLAEFEKYAENDEILITDIVLHDALARTITFQKKQDFIIQPGYTNIAVAAYTTAHARMRLYEALEIIGKNILYCDTDSVIYIDDGTIPLTTGKHLGDLTDELKEGDYIIEFVSTGPKSYAYKTNDGNICCKIKGVTLNYKNSQKVNFESVKELVRNKRYTELETETLQFNIGKDHKIRTNTTTNKKKFKFTFDKRKIINTNTGDIDSVPFY